jgi:hypothetical protein
MSFESASTATIRAASDPVGNTPGVEMQMDVSGPSSYKARYIIATDFGTTFSAVAWLNRAEGHPSESTLISNYDNDPLSTGHHPNLQVPTESWYIQNNAEIIDNLPEDVDETEDLYGSSDRDSATEAESSAVEDRMELDTEYMSIENTEGASDEPTRFHWGYSIRRFISPDMDRNRFNRVSRSKLLLDQSPRTQDIRDELKPILERLKGSKIKRKRIIERDEDVIADYLTQLYRHAKRELEKSGVPDNSIFEHVLCIPAIWGANACREMQNAAAIAVEKSGLGTMDNFFLVSEPEAAAAFVLAKQRDELNVSTMALIFSRIALTRYFWCRRETSSYCLMLVGERLMPLPIKLQNGSHCDFPTKLLSQMV